MSDSQKGGLGRGLSALLPGKQPVAPTVEAATTEDALASGAVSVVDGGPSGAAVVRELAIELIDPNPRQPRRDFADSELEDLASSIRELGVLQPILVRPSGERYELIAGERRLRASLRAGNATVPAIIRELEDARMLIDALVENIQRVDLDPIDEAAALRGLVDDLGATHDDVAKRIGKSRASVTNSLRLLSLAPEVQRRVKEGALSAGHARSIAGLADEDAQRRVAQRVIAEGMNVRATEALVSNFRPSEKSSSDNSVRSAAPKTNRGQVPAGVLEAEVLLNDRLETRVEIDHAANARGRISIEYSGLEDLDRIVRAILDVSPDSEEG